MIRLPEEDSKEPVSWVQREVGEILPLGVRIILRIKEYSLQASWIEIPDTRRMSAGLRAWGKMRRVE